MSDRHVVPAAEGWHVEKNNAQRPSATAPTQAEAIKRAVEIVANDGGGQVIVHGNDGEIRENRTVARHEDHTTRTAAGLATVAAAEGAEVTAEAAADEAADTGAKVAEHTRTAATRAADDARIGGEHAAATADAAADGIGREVSAVAYGTRPVGAGARTVTTIAATAGGQISEQAERTGRQVLDETTLAAHRARRDIGATANRGARAARKQADRAAHAGAGVGDELDTAADRTGRRIHTATETLAAPLDTLTDRALADLARLTRALNPVRITGRSLGVTIAGGLYLASLLTARSTRAAQQGVHAATRTSTPTDGED